jgi:hypothetical protein
MFVLTEVEMFNESGKVFTEVLKVINAQAQIKFEKFEDFLGLLNAFIGKSHEEIDIEVVMASNPLVEMARSLELLIIFKKIKMVQLSHFLHTAKCTSSCSVLTNFHPGRSAGYCF